MKKLFLVLVAAITVQLSYAQDAKKILKDASKELAKYYQDPTNNATKLETAVTSVNNAFKDETVKADADSWLIRAEIYNTIATSDGNIQLIKPDYKSQYPGAALEAVDAYKKVMELGVKKNHTKDALKGLIEVENNLSNAGINAYSAQDYLGAFKNFNTLVEISKLIKSNGGKTRLDEKEFGSNIKYYNAVCGYYGKADHAQLLPVLEDLYSSGADSVLVYEALFAIKSKTDEAGALKILEAGRKKYPEETGLLFSEINYYLGKGKLDVLIDKLKAAIKKEPNNTSVYTTLGNVYEQLIAKEIEAGNTAKSEEYFNSAMDIYNQTIKIDPKNFDATYSLGAMYYNKAAALVPELNKLSNDFSKAGTAKYDGIKTSMNGFFDQALPFFIKAESLNGKDLNTLIALKEIYAKKNDFEKSNKYKGLIEAMKK